MNLEQILLFLLLCMLVYFVVTICTLQSKLLKRDKIIEMYREEVRTLRAEKEWRKR